MSLALEKPHFEAEAGDRVGALAERAEKARAALQQLERRLAEIDPAIDEATPRNDERELGRLYAERGRLKRELPTARASVKALEAAHGQAREAAEAAGLREQRARILTQREAFAAHFADDVESHERCILSVLKTADVAQAMAEKIAERFGETLRAELIFASAKFQRGLLLPRLKTPRQGEPPGEMWNHYHELARRPDIEPLADFSLDALQRLAQSPPAMSGSEGWGDYFAKVTAALKDAGKRLTPIYLQAAQAIAELFRDEWRIRRDILDFNRRAAEHRWSVEPLFADMARNWRPVEQMGFNILLPSPTVNGPPILAGGATPATIEGWDDRAKGGA